MKKARFNPDILLVKRSLQTPFVDPRVRITMQLGYFYDDPNRPYMVGGDRIIRGTLRMRIPFS